MQSTGRVNHGGASADKRFVGPLWGIGPLCGDEKRRKAGPHGGGNGLGKRIENGPAGDLSQEID
jgi:hypothetical protein